MSRSPKRLLRYLTRVRHSGKERKHRALLGRGHLEPGFAVVKSGNEMKAGRVTRTVTRRTRMHCQKEGGSLGV